MQIVYSCCCGLDVHKKSITACVLWAEARGEKRKEKRVFGTFTRDPLKLSDGCESAVSDRLLWSRPGSTGSRCGTFWKGSLRSCW